MKAARTLPKQATATILSLPIRTAFADVACVREAEERAALLRTFGTLSKALNFFRK